MDEYQPIVVYTGPNSEAFGKLFGKIGLCDARFVHANGGEQLSEALSQNPCAVAIIECHGDPEILIRMIGDFPKATIVGFTDDMAIADKLAMANIFDIVLGSDRGWRLLFAVRNAINTSALIEFWACVDRDMEES